MRNLILFTIILLVSCSKGDDLDISCEEDCDFMNPIGFAVDPLNESVLLRFSSGAFYENPGKSCAPDAFDIYISENRIDFEKVARVDDDSGSYLIEDLKNGEIISFKVVAIHCELDSIVSIARTVTVGEIPLPQFINNPMPSPLNQFEDFRLAPDGDRFIFRANSNEWFLSSFSNPIKGERVFFDAFFAQWNQNVENEIAGIEKIDVGILPNLNGTTSKTLVGLDLNSGSEQILHEIENHWDFDSNVYNPDIYWIHEFHYSLDGNSIYFLSNKDNGSATNQEQRIYDNIWRLDLSTKEIEAISDFYPIEFDFEDFVEDPRQEGNFYITGGTYNEKVETESGFYFITKEDIHYFNSIDQSLTPILISADEKKYLSIDPSGENLVFETSVTGNSELWSYNLSSQQVKQITHSKTYTPSFKWHHIDWISENEFMTYVRHEDILKFAVFSI